MPKDLRDEAGLVKRVYENICSGGTYPEGWQGVNLPDASFELFGNTLRVHGELCSDCERDFEDALRKLIATVHASFVVDLSNVRFMSSSYVRHIIRAMAWATQKDRSITVRAKGPTLRLLQLAGVDRLGKIELVNSD